MPCVPITGKDLSTESRQRSNPLDQIRSWQTACSRTTAALHSGWHECGSTSITNDPDNLADGQPARCQLTSNRLLQLRVISLDDGVLYLQEEGPALHNQVRRMPTPSKLTKFGSPKALQLLGHAQMPWNQTNPGTPPRILLLGLFRKQGIPLDSFNLARTSAHPQASQPFVASPWNALPQIEA